jgi:hypothetical protein
VGGKGDDPVNSQKWTTREAIEWAESEGRAYLIVELAGDQLIVPSHGLDGYFDSDVVFGTKDGIVVGWIEVGTMRREHRMKTPKGIN